MDVMSRGWSAQSAAVAAYDEASTAGWESDYLAARETPTAPYDSPWLPTCPRGCRDPWAVDPACTVHAADSKERND